MKNFNDKVAVITGAASGIGKEIAESCAQKGMKIILADVEKTALDKVESQLRSKGAEVVSIQTDVSKANEVEKLAKKTLDIFNGVHLLVNNAGVVAGTSSWESSLNDWEWVMNVNLMGIVHGLHYFVPIMLEQDTEAHIVNNASATGLVSYNLSAPYQVAKHGVVSLSEHLHYSLQQRNAKIGVSVLCTAWVKTRILNSRRNRPDELKDSSRKTQSGRKHAAPYVKKIRQAIKTGMPPKEVANHVFDAIQNEDFYIITHPSETIPLVQHRMEGILNQKSPSELDIDELLFLDSQHKPAAGPPEEQQNN